MRRTLATWLALERHAERLHAGGFRDDATAARRQAVDVHVEARDSTERFMLGGDCWERAEEELAAGRAEKAIAILRANGGGPDLDEALSLRAAALAAI